MRLESVFSRLAIHRVQTNDSNIRVRVFYLGIGSGFQGIGMIKEIVTAGLLLALSATLLADTRQAHDCERSGIKRMVELIVANPSGVPCQVVYSKPMEGQTSQRLWNATNDANFCQEKYDGFIVKLESELDWTCTARVRSDKINKTSDVDLSPLNTPSTVTSPEVDSEPVNPDATTTDVNTLADALSADQEVVVPTINANPLNANPLTESTLTGPILSAALPDNPLTEENLTGISLDMMRHHFPTGYYSSSPEIPHTGDTALCPADGFYIWNTQQPNLPAFEMGRDAAFVFNLGQTAGATQVISTDARSTQPCGYDIISSYCLSNEPQGSSITSNIVAKSLGCDSQRSSNEPTRPMALLSVLTARASDACSVDSPPAAMMGLARLPVDSETTGGFGIEIAIAEDDTSSSRRANCRYVRGR